ncbi:MAG: methyltransferase [Deltaproteobacteria bacterium]|nr:methyltransferase [Deltaproteobacteria bacterium]
MFCALRDACLEYIGPYRYMHGTTGQRMTSDTLRLSEFVLPLKQNDSVIDLGTGAGVLPLIFAARSGCANIKGVEVMDGASQTARQNVAANGLTGRIAILKMDLRKLPEVYGEGSFSVVVSNPPYVKAGAGRVSPVKERAVARSEQMCTLPELIKVSKHLAGKSGRICFVFPARRLQEMLSTLGSAGLKPRRLKFINTQSERPARRFLIEA